MQGSQGRGEGSGRWQEASERPQPVRYEPFSIC
jgi:hypothetical protein